MRHEVNRLSDLCFSVGKRRLSVAAHYEICKATVCLAGRVRIDHGQRSRMNGIERIEQSLGLNSADFSEVISAICGSTFAVWARGLWGVPFLRIRPRTSKSWGQIDLTQIFCPRLFWSSPMPSGYRSVSVGNGRTLRGKCGVCLQQNYLAGSCQFITGNGISNTNRNPFCNRRTIAAVDEHQFQRLEISDWNHTDILRVVSAKRSGSKAIPTPSCTRSVASE
jgi:hypothetical protein